MRCLFIFFVMIQSVMFGQLAVTNNAPMNTEEYLVNDILCDDGLTTSNFSSTGFASGIGYFDGFAANLGFDEGIVLSTGEYVYLFLIVVWVHGREALVFKVILI